MKPELNTYLTLLKKLIQTPSYSGEESGSADLLSDFLSKDSIRFSRIGNNIICKTKPVNYGLKILLNSHHDTVKPVAGYTRDPFDGAEESGNIYGLGSNDAGASLISLLYTFHTYSLQNNLPFQLIFVASAEEEISGIHGIRSVLNQEMDFDFGIVGEPTSMQAAIEEKGLMVLDCYVDGKSAHAAHGSGDNAILNALKCIQWFQSFEFNKVSEFLGKVRMNVTQIQAGTQHNVIPDTCHFVVDVRNNSQYQNEEIVEIIRQHVPCKIQPRSTILNGSSIPVSHPLVQAAIAAGCKCYGSPTLSDQSLMPFPTVKIGPGESGRSHTADEFIRISEIENAVQVYQKIIDYLKENVAETLEKKSVGIF